MSKLSKGFERVKLTSGFMHNQEQNNKEGRKERAESSSGYSGGEKQMMDGSWLSEELPEGSTL